MQRRLILLIALGLSACAGPAYVGGLRPTIPDVDWAAHREARLTSKDAVTLLYQSWRPKSGEPKAAVLLVHGLKDHSDRYSGFAKALVEAGYAVHAFDLRGHGDSTGDRVCVDHFDDYLDDVDAALTQVRAAEGDKKIFLFGHSMGGAIVTLYALTRTPKPAGIVLSAAALKVDAGGAVQGTTKALGALFPKLAVFSLEDEKFSRDAEVVADMKRDPLVYDKSAPAHTAAEVIRAVDRIREHSAELDVPVLAMHGTADEVTPPDGSKELVDAAKGDKTLKLYAGLYHDLLHEPERAQVTADIIAWLEARAAQR
jgi:alpha-beta hydrolase superfamily lysophospholipase